MPNKVDYIVVQSFRVISHLNCLGKVYEILVAEMLADWCQVNHILHKGQMSSRIQRRAIDTVAPVTQRE